jgi:hypothetical protein
VFFRLKEIVFLNELRYFFQADFSYIFVLGKSLTAENSAEFLGKSIFQNFFRGKFNSSQHLWGKIFGGIFPKIFPGKNVRKIGPWWRFYHLYMVVKKICPNGEILHNQVRQRL